MSGLHKETLVLIKQKGIGDTHTFMPGVFFKDGFLWGKTIAPFFGFIFFVYLFMGAVSCIKTKSIEPVLYAVFVTLAGIVAQIFSSFPPGIDVMSFTPPFYIVMFVFGTAALAEFSGYIQDKKSVHFNAKNILYAALLVVVLYNLMLTFNHTIAKSSNIKNLYGYTHAQKFLTR